MFNFLLSFSLRVKLSLMRSYTLLYLLQDGHIYTCALKQVQQFLKRLSTELLHDPAVLPLGRYSREMKAYVPTKTCRNILKTAFFIMAKEVEITQMSING